MTTTVPNNGFVDVATLQDGQLAYLQNLAPMIGTANTKFKDFEKIKGNLGSTVQYTRKTRFVTNNSLVASFQPVEQQYQDITVNQQISTSYAFDATEQVFHVDEFMDEFGSSAVREVGTKIEANVSLNAISGVVDNNSRSATYGQKDFTSGPTRCYGDGTTAINSYGQLAQMLANFGNIGCAKDNMRVYLPDTIVPQIINSGLSQFATDRNNEIANSWEIGSFKNAMFYESNLLPIQYAGTLGNEGTTLTLVSTNDSSGANVTELTFSGAGTDSQAIKAGDIATFLDGVSGQPNIRLRTEIGHEISRQSVQFRANIDAASSGGNVTVSISPPLVWQSGNPNQNLSHALAAGMQVEFLPSHSAGLIVSGNALFLAMPKLPNQIPFPTANKSDPDTGVSLRLTYGSILGENAQGFINDGIWGSHLDSKYCMRVAFPITQ